MLWRVDATAPCLLLVVVLVSASVVDEQGVLRFGKRAVEIERNEPGKIIYISLCYANMSDWQEYSDLINVICQEYFGLEKEKCLEYLGRFLK
uniref:Secreted protein n=1 Tax=Heterorhabditis bacteriophora TaxID=37862 RepID=A0A1I7XA80_HETBA